MLKQYISNQYLRALAIIAIVFVILKIIVFIIEKIFLVFAGKTKTDIDDLIIKKSSMPISLIIIIFGIKLSLDELSLSNRVLDLINNSLDSLIIILIGFIIYFIVDLVTIKAIEKLIAKTDSKVDKSLLNFTHGLLKVILVISIFLYILSIWGIKIGPFLAGLGVAGIAIAFALQSTLSNIFGGISMLLDKSIKTGDLVYLDDNTKGKILKIGLRSTKIRTFDNELIIIPNGKLSESKIQNVALPEPKTRVVVPFGVAYGSDIAKVKKIVLNEIKKIKSIESEPAPTVRFLEMAESSLNFKAYFYVKSFEDRFVALDEANTLIYNALNKNKISIPFPQLDVWLKKDK